MLAAQGDFNLGFNWEALLDPRKPTTWLQYINLNLSMAFKVISLVREAGAARRMITYIGLRISWL